MRDTFVRKLCELAEQDKDLYLMTGDLGYNVLDKFETRYPKRFLNAGICEQNMASVAAGMALMDKKVYIYSIGNFPTLRCLEQIRNDIAYHEANVKIVSVGGGFAYGPMGMTHHATEDVAILRSIPGLKVFTPADPYETEKVVEIANQEKGPVYIRLGKGKEKDLIREEELVYGEICLRKAGEENVILAMGPVAQEAIEAAEKLPGTAVYTVPFIKPLKRERILEIAKKYGTIYTVEEHNRVGGLGSTIAEIISDAGYPTKVVRLGLDETFTSVVGSQMFLRKQYGIDCQTIVEKIKERTK